MSLPPHTAPAGWYPDSHGQLRWWDGAAWGAVAAPQPVAPGITTAPARQARPARSKLSLAAMLLTVLAWGFWLASTFTPVVQPERCQTQECWNAVADGSLYLGSVITPAVVLGWLVAPLLIVAVVLGIVGLARAAQRGFGLLGLLLPAGTILLMLVPSILMMFGLLAWGVLGAASQASGGTTFG